MKNKLVDLNDHLFAQLERLSEEEIDDTALSQEINRTKAITSVAREIISNGTLALEARRLKDDGMIAGTPTMLGLDSK